MNKAFAVLCVRLEILNELVKVGLACLIVAALKDLFVVVLDKHLLIVEFFRYKSLASIFLELNDLLRF